MPNTAIFVDITNKELENSVKFSNLTIEKFEVKNEVATGIYETGNLIKCDIVFFANGKRYVGNKRLYSNYQNTITGETKNDVEPNSAYFVKVSVLGNTESATEDFDFDIVLLGEKEELELQLFYEREDLFGVIGTFTTNEDSLYSVDSLKVFPYDYLANSSSQNVIVDDKLSTSSENPVQNKVITKALEDIYLSVEKIIIDDELDSQSTNAIQNKVVANEFKNVEGNFATMGDVINTIQNKTNKNGNDISALEGRVGELEATGGECGNVVFDYTKYDVPKVYINGDFASIDEKTDIIKCDYLYENNGATKTGYCTAKWQGSSSLNYPKKNFTIKFYKDEECTSKDKFEAKTGWGNEYKYCFKADWIDFSHSRNVVSAELWGDVVNSRKDVDTEGTISNILSQVPNGGAIDGFPIFLVINGEWQGIYNWNIPKDDWTLGMGKGVGQKEAILCASGNNSANFAKDAVIGKDYDLEYATDEKDADGNQKPETISAIQNSINNLIRLVNASDGTDIDTTIAKYVDIQSVIDYFLFVVLTDNYDGILKNYLLGSYDYELTDENGNFVDYGKWFFGAYDLDAVFGLTINGKPDSFGNAFRDFTYSQAKDVAPIHKLFKLLWDYKNEDIIKRYKEIVKESMSLASVTTKFCNYTSKIPLIAYDEDAKLWTGVTNTSTNNLTQVITWYENRLDFLNNKLLGSDGGELYTKIGAFTLTPQEVTVSAGQTEIPVTLKFMDSIAVYHNETKLTVNTDYSIDTENKKIVLSISVADGDTIKIQNELNQVYASEVSVGSGKKISRLNMVNNLKEFYIVADFPVAESKIAVDGGAFNYSQRLFQFYTDGAINTTAKTFYASGIRSKGLWEFEKNSDTTANVKKADYTKAVGKNRTPKNFGSMYFNKPVTNIGVTTYPTSAVFPQGTTFTLWGVEE